MGHFKNVDGDRFEVVTPCVFVQPNPNNTFCKIKDLEVSEKNFIFCKRRYSQLFKNCLKLTTQLTQQRFHYVFKTL